MTGIQEKYINFKSLFTKINDKLDNLSDESLFDDILAGIKEDAYELERLKSEILQTGELSGEIPDLSTKQIQTKFDNIIRSKKLEMDGIQEQIFNLSNSKKLSTYKRD